jgi:hypothetical protein
MKINKVSPSINLEANDEIPDEINAIRSSDTSPYGASADLDYAPFNTMVLGSRDHQAAKASTINYSQHKGLPNRQGYFSR